MSTRGLASRRRGLLLFLLAGRAAAQSPETDALGDPLRQAARLRLGTRRCRHPSSVVDLALSPDENTVVTVGREIIARETDTGKERWRASATQHGLDLPGASYGARGLAF